MDKYDTLEGFLDETIDFEHDERVSARLDIIARILLEIGRDIKRQAPKTIVIKPPFPKVIED